MTPNHQDGPRQLRTRGQSRQGARARTAADSIAYAKAHPGTLSYGSSGTGSMQQMAAALFEARTQIKMLHVPYKGTGALLGDLVAGHVDMIFADQGTMMQQVKAGKLAVLGVGGLQRVPEYPDIPTLAEAAKLPGFEVVAWQGLAGPAGLPAAVVDEAEPCRQQGPGRQGYPRQAAGSRPGAGRRIGRRLPPLHRRRAAEMGQGRQ